MDLIALAYYAIVCGLLAVLVPPALRLPVRFLIGVLVGIAAAFALPLIHALLSLGP